jgi:hypothetical protein
MLHSYGMCKVGHACTNKASHNDTAIDSNTHSLSSEERGRVCGCLGMHCAATRCEDCMSGHFELDRDDVMSL